MWWFSAFLLPKKKNHMLKYVSTSLNILIHPAGLFLPVPFNEESALDPSNKHVQTENQLRKEFGQRLTIVRLAGLVGAGRFPVRMMSKSGKIYNGDEYCNLIHLDDAVGIIAFLIGENPRVEILNACAPQHPPKGEYYTAMAERLSVPAPVFEKGPTGKFIQSDLSISLGYEYSKPDPYDFI
jgi:nucleoside-diphosphate-sugar epimerase